MPSARDRRKAVVQDQRPERPPSPDGDGEVLTALFCPLRMRAACIEAAQMVWVVAERNGPIEDGSELQTLLWVRNFAGFPPPPVEAHVQHPAPI